MQDNKQASLGSNAVKQPNRQRKSLLSHLMNVIPSLYSLHLMWQFEFYRHPVLIKHSQPKVTGKRELSLSSDIDVHDIKKKAKELGATVNEYFLAAISVAVY